MTGSIVDELRSIDLGKIPGRQLLVPPGRKFLEWHQQNPGKATKRHLGISKENKALEAYMEVAKMKRLGPESLIPLGILTLCHNMYSPQKCSFHDIIPGAQDITKRYPFGVLLGCDVRQAVLESSRYKQRNKRKDV
jgi:hypothetical protein